MMFPAAVEVADGTLKITSRRFAPAIGPEWGEGVFR
jgi:hypothetical protein